MIPPHLHFEEPSPHIAWEQLPVRVPTSPTPWPGGYPTRIAGVSSFGFSGTNAHVILEEPPPQIPTPAALEAQPYLLPISARTPAALRELAGAYLGFLAAHDSEVRDICYSAALRRNHYEERLAVTGAAAGELRSGLVSWLNGLEEAVSIA
jgi:acyl transferase domain-containing protein